MKRILAAAFLVPWLIATAMAHDNPPLYDQVNLSVSVEKKIANDTLVAVVYAQSEGQQQAIVADEVNKQMKWALAAAKSVSAVQAQTLNYNTSPIYQNQNRRITGWRARQSLRLESTDSESITKLLGQLQQRLGVESVQYTVSKQARAAAEDDLITRGIAAFQARADLIASASKRSGYRLARMDVGNSAHHRPTMQMRGAAMMESAAAVRSAPSIEAGEQTLTVNVSGTVELDPLR